MKTTNSLLPLKALFLVIILTALTVIPGTLLAGNKDGDKKVETSISIPDFSAIRASTGIEVIYTQGKSTGVAKVITTENGLQRLKVEVQNGCLTVSYKNMTGNVQIKGPTIVSVQSPALKKVNLSSAAKLTVMSDLNQQSKVKFELSSASKVTLGSVNCDDLEVDLSSAASFMAKNVNSGRVEVEGSSSSKALFDKIESSATSFQTSSAASVAAVKVTGSTLNTDASSGANISVKEVDCMQVTADASSGAKVVLSGKCAMLTKEHSSGGRVDTSGLSQSQEPTAAKKSKRSTKRTTKSQSSEKSEGVLRIP